MFMCFYINDKNKLKGCEGMEILDNERIKDAKNRVFNDAMGLGRNNPISLHTKSSSLYRRTGMEQIADMINCGYIRPKEKVKGGHIKEVFWSKGSEKLFYYDKSPILEVLDDKVVNGQIGALSINELQGIWIFSDSQNKYVNRLDFFRKLYQERLSQSQDLMTVEEATSLFSDLDRDTESQLFEQKQAR